MSSLTPANIAASVAQGALQQSQTAKGRDAVRNQAAYHVQRLHKLKEKNLESVEDSYETSDEHLTVRDDDSNPNQQDPRDRKDEDRDDEHREHIDIRA